MKYSPRHSLKFILLVVISFLSSRGWPQKSLVKSFATVSFAEKVWVMKHPFIAKRAWKVTERVRGIADSLRRLSIPDQDGSGGKADAFRHAFWMASLTKQIGARCALSLGRAHERGDYQNFKKMRYEEGDIPDKAAGDMDLYNNIVGSAIGNELKKSDEKIVIDAILSAIHKGTMKIILKDHEGRACDTLMQPISASSMKGKWVTPRVLVKSNYVIIK
jgi:hypothetical protein